MRSWVDSLVLRLRGYGKRKIYRRPLSEWLLLLDEVGFTIGNLRHRGRGRMARREKG